MKSFLRARILIKCDRILHEDALDLIRRFNPTDITEFNALRTTIIKLYNFDIGDHDSYMMPEMESERLQDQFEEDYDRWCRLKHPEDYEDRNEAEIIKSKLNEIIMEIPQ